ncbi:MAG: hypothetical protein KF768_02380 [Phycisphaeraceae bacterium]|nr:hypothetical protein [Phycisphaeraceae bacterium]
MNDHAHHPDTDRALADVEALARAERAAADAHLEARVHAASVDRLAEPLPADLISIAAALDDLAHTEARASDRLADAVFAASVSALVPASLRRERHAPARHIHDRPTVLARIGLIARGRIVRVAAAVALLVGGSAIFVQVRNQQARKSEVRALAASIDARLDDLFLMLEAADNSETADAGDASDESARLDVFLRSLEGRL